MEIPFLTPGQYLVVPLGALAAAICDMRGELAELMDLRAAPDIAADKALADALDCLGARFAVLDSLSETIEQVEDIAVAEPVP